ncbi:MAG: beta-ketoacyl-[acyl-carrier-protein] synthase family protein [Candidatus Sumerlaeaceae bacterium]
MSRENAPVAITGVGVVCPLGYRHGQVIAALRDNETSLRLTDIGLDAEVFFGLVPNEFFRDAQELLARLPEAKQQAAKTDPGLLYGLWATRAALEQARLVIDNHCCVERVASTVSSSKGFLRCYLEEHRRLYHDVARNSGDQNVGALVESFFADTLGHWLAQIHGFCGPVLSVSAACATGLVSVLLGASLIRDGIADVVLAGSAECTRNAVAMAGFVNMGAFSSDRCRPFHRERSGFNAGEGAAVFVLESLPHALARGARALGIIRGGDFRSEAYHITAVEPGSETAEFSICNTLRKAQWQPKDVEYINAHGTGTPLNDRAEAMLIERIFGAEQPLLSSFKGHIGHLLGASASVELALALLALDAGFIPPTFGLDDPDPEFRVRFVAPSGECKQVSKFLKLALGFGGQVAVVAIERPGGASEAQVASI